MSEYKLGEYDRGTPLQICKDMISHLEAILKAKGESESDFDKGYFAASLNNYRYISKGLKRYLAWHDDSLYDALRNATSGNATDSIIEEHITELKSIVCHKEKEC